MKALELTIFERNEDGDYLETPASDGKRYVIAQEDVEVYCMTKALTDAEVASEYWRHNGDADAVCEGLCVETFGGLTANGLFAEDLMNARLSTLYRFATLPHYDEDQP